MQLIAWRDGNCNLLIDPEEIRCLNVVCSLNEEAESIYELYKNSDLIFQPGSIWKDVVLIPTRHSHLQELKTAIAEIEKPAI